MQLLDAKSIDSFVLRSIQQVTPMVRNLATRYNAEFEDVLQQASLVIVSIAARALTETRNPQAWVQNYVNCQMKSYLLTPHRFDMSIDEPLSDENDFSLIDTLVSPEQGQEQDYTHDDHLTHAVHTALRRLPLEEQMYLRRVHDLNSFNPLPSDWSRKPQYDRPVKSIAQSAYRRLRHDELLTSVLEVQA